MPSGIIINVLSVLLGGLLGSCIKDYFPEVLKKELTSILGLASMGMGISVIVLMKNMPAVILALIAGTALGLLLKFGNTIHTLAERFSPKGTKAEDHDMFVTAAVLFCASATGVYGALMAGMNGDMSILLCKSILDFVTAMIFACTLGKTIGMIAIPQFIILMVLYLLAGCIVPLTTPEMILDFKACGGLIMLATGFRMLNLKMFPIADMIPAMLLVMPLSWLWGNVILNLL